MKANQLIHRYDINSWRKYRPFEPQYAKFSPHEILAGFKIEDICIQYGNARASLLCMEVDDYGRLIASHDKLHFVYIRSKFLFDSLANYNYCIDLSWQFLYLYYGYNDYGMIQDRGRYENETKECNKENLRYRLVGLAKEQEKFDYIMSFLEIPLTKEIRSAYNYIKHRGTYHIEGLGINNDECFPMDFNGNKLRMITRKTIDIDEWKEKLVEFDISFYKYFDKLIKQIMPVEFPDGTFYLDDLVKLSRKIDNWYQTSSTT